MTYFYIYIIIGLIISLINQNIVYSTEEKKSPVWHHAVNAFLITLVWPYAIVRTGVALYEEYKGK